MKGDIVTRWVVNFKAIEGFRYAHQASPVQGWFETEEVSAGQHSYDLTTFRTDSGKEYSDHEVYAGEAEATAVGESSVAACLKRLKRIMEHFE